MPYVAVPSFSFRRKRKHFRSIMDLVNAYTTGDLDPNWIVRDVSNIETPLSVPEIMNGFNPSPLENLESERCVHFLAERFEIKHGFRPNYGENPPPSGMDHFRHIAIYGRVPTKFKLTITPAEHADDKSRRMGKWASGDGIFSLVNDQYASIENRLSERSFDDLVVTLYLEQKEGAKFDDPLPTWGIVTEARFRFLGSLGNLR